MAWEGLALPLSGGRRRSSLAPALLLVGLGLGLRGLVTSGHTGAQQALTLPVVHAGHDPVVHVAHDPLLHHVDHDHGHGHGHGHAATGSEIAVGCGLLGSIIFIMSLFYLVNFPDDDIRRYSWDVISSTISIFVSVLLYQGLDDLTEHALRDLVKNDVLHEVSIMIMDCAKFALFYAVMQRAIAKLAHHEHVPEGCEDKEERLARHEQRLKCWSTLLAHLTGFAALDAFNELQEMQTFRQSMAMSTVPLLLLGCVLFVVFRVTDWARSAFSAEGADEEAEEAENEVAAFALSFLLVHIVRIGIMGSGVDHDGGEVLGRTDVVWCTSLLLLAGVAFGVAMYFSCQLLHEDGKHGVEHESYAGLDPIDVYLKRWCFILFEVCGMSLAWCLLFACKWANYYGFVLGGVEFSVHSPILAASVALACSLLAFAMIFLLDKVADNLKEGSDLIEKVVRVVIKSLSVLVGFGWEQAFHSSMVVVVEQVLPGQSRYGSLISQIMIGVAVAVVVVPAWRMYIVKTVHELHEEHEHAHAKHSDHH